MTKTPEEEKKSGDEKTYSNDVNLSPRLSTPHVEPDENTRSTLAPRTIGPEPYFEGTALEGLLGSQANAGDTIKARNISPKPRHQRGVSWDLGTPELRLGNTDGNVKKDDLTKPPAVNRGVSVPVSALGGGKPPIRGGKSNRFMTPSRPSIISRKSSNNDSSLGSANSPVRDRYAALQKPSNMELEVENYVNEVNKHEVNAETNLMRKLDEKDPLRPRAGTGASILSEVPVDEIEHNFIIEDQDGLVLPSSKDESSTRVKQSPKKPVEKGHHKRQMTVEQALFGLTSALSEMKANDQLERNRHGHHESVGTHGSNDIFDVAGALFDRAHKKNVPSKVPVEDKQDDARPRLNSQENKSKQNVAAPSRWGAIKNNLGELKKTDDGILNDVESSKGDVEEGINEDIDSSDMDYSGDTQESSGDNGPSDPRKARFGWIKKRKKVNPFKHLPYANKVKEEWDVFNKFLNPRKQSLRMYIKIILMYIMIPATAIAAALFYLAENPPYGYCPVEGCDPRKPYPSASWWILFIGCRQVVIACLCKITESIVIDFLALRTQFTLRFFGPMVTLLLVQSRGWPFLLFCFGMYNFALVVGDSPFSNHWLFWQPYIGMFNRQNPPGFVTSSLPFYRICAVAMGVGAAVAVKRMAVGIYLGRKTFANYSQSLTLVMNKMLQLNELARFGRALEDQTVSSSRKGSGNGGRVSQVADERLHELLDIANQQSEDDNLTFSRERSMRSSQQGETFDDMDKVIDPTDIDPYTGSLSSVQKQRICDLLGQWEEPARQSTSMADEVASVGAVMQFKRALAHMDTDFPFGGAFGAADTREACVQCSQKLYDRLLLQENGVSGILHFNAIALIAMDRNGDLDTEKTKDLIRIFRPDRDGAISLVDFVRSIDNVYKELRLLRATVAGSTKIDKALESIFNWGFFVFLACVILWVLDIDPFALFVSLSSVVLAFAFMIGSASSKYFEGLLLIVVQRPYGIGDRINIANPEVPGDTAGSQGWIVEDVTLFTTTLCLAATSERATIANGMLAKSRIINGARSPNAIVYVVMRFGIETSYRKVELFRSAVEKFVRARPREWSGMLGFRVSRIEADLGFIEYTTALRHRESWQNIVPILNSRNTMHAFCLELAKKLDMRYKNPPLPVDLKMQGQLPPQFDLRFNNEELAGEQMHARAADPTHSPGSQSYNSESLAQVAAMFDE